MTAEDVAALVKRDLESGAFDNSHGITQANIHAFLITPALEQYEDELDASRVREYWTILHEDPTGGEGYTIFYSEEDGMFGLAVSGNTAKYASIGFYGTLRETLTGM